MSVSLHAAVTPATLPAGAAADLSIQLVLRNDGTKPTTVYPGAAKLAAIASFAGLGVTWGLVLVDAAGTAMPIQELRRWYGPPGNPPPPSAATQHAVKLKPGAEHATTFAACWIPNALLAAKHLDPATIDPQGMDGIGPSEHALRPPVASTFPLAQASVLVVGEAWSTLEPAMHTEDDFLRGHVVAFVPAAGTYELRAGYNQASFMGFGTGLQCAATPVRLQVGTA